MTERGSNVILDLSFYLARPKQLPKRITRPGKKPDLDKLIRATLDSLTGTVFEDDSQVVRVLAEKFYGLPERVEIIAEAIGA